MNPVKLLLSPLRGKRILLRLSVWRLRRKGILIGEETIVFPNCDIMAHRGG